MFLTLGIIFLLCIIVMGAVLVITAVRSNKHTGDLITKKNLFYLAPAFLIVYFMLMTAAAYNGTELNVFYCFSLIGATLDIFKFKLTSSLVLPICQAYPIFYVDYILAFILGVLTAILSVASFFSRRISNYFHTRRLLRNKCDIVLGDSDDSLQYVKNVANSLVLATKISAQKYADLLKQHTPVIRCELNARSLSRVFRNDGYAVIVFRDGNYSYSKIIDVFGKITNCCSVDIHLEANQSEMKILKEKFIAKANDNSRLFVTGFSKYELLARKFVVEHPITKYIPRNFYNENFSLKEDKEIHVVFVGFGKVNYQLFRMCCMQFQFAQEKQGKLASKPVHYHVYDSQDAALHNDFFSRIKYEFDEDFAHCDFPKPEIICDLDIHKLDTNSVEAKKQFKSYVSHNNFAYFIVSLENDLEDASYAQTIKRLLVGDNYRIFVRAKNTNGERLNDADKQVVYFGDEKEIYTHENIVNDDLSELAQRINLLYNKIADSPEWVQKMQAQKDLDAEQQRKILDENLAKPENAKYMQHKWAELPNIEQESNLYHALNLPFKLNLLGFDMVKRNDGDDAGVSEEEFNLRYKNSGSKTHYNDYAFFFGNESSNVLAYVEHSRWNALYILYDYKQMKKADLKIVEKSDDSGNVKRAIKRKDPDLKQHACLTTYYGLHELIEYQLKMLYPNETLSKANYKDNEHLQEMSSIYAYDYMDLDRLYSEIIAMGYKLIDNDKTK